jgi:alkylhydroperoxidase family enzyme
MAESPQLLKAHLAIRELFDKASLAPQERQIVRLTISRENHSAYGTAQHSVAAEEQHVPAEIITDIRQGHPLKDKKLEALRSFTAKTVNSRGLVKSEDIKEFLDAGYSRANILEVILAVGMATLADYTNHIAKTPLDDQFASKAWKQTG